ncbi:hypothetical protein ALNOE001_08190 [Candidatus Methanobinarius endosymbioticus]|uniref:Right handed beta helix domain-containing protein n=1 Tax=Candidatus Methanobinarius endosymbioticus TaxID=2006182 RepID=A0A366MBM3_9EURY|nr:hypothetical protein ALNOE001_08190 [Candidatus Methanobinarius endosymbioticus]
MKIPPSGNHGILFNISNTNISLINLTMTGYITAVYSTQGNITITNNNINTSNSSIYIGRNSTTDLKGISIQNNNIISEVSNSTSYSSTVMIYIDISTGRIIDVYFARNNISITTESKGMRVYISYYDTGTIFSSINLTFENNNITVSAVCIYFRLFSSNNTNLALNNNNLIGNKGVTIYALERNNNITGTSDFGADLGGCNNININLTNNNIKGSKDVVLGIKNINNSNATFHNNNIKGSSYAIHTDFYDSLVICIC